MVNKGQYGGPTGLGRENPPGRQGESYFSQSIHESAVGRCIGLDRYNNDGKAYQCCSLSNS